MQDSERKTEDEALVLEGPGDDGREDQTGQHKEQEEQANKVGIWIEPAILTFFQIRISDSMSAFISFVNANHERKKIRSF